MSDPSLIGRLWYNTADLASFVLFTFGFSFRRSGFGNIPRTGPVLVVSNHQSMFDPMMMGVASRRYLTFLARSTLFTVPILGPVIRSLNSVPIDRNVGKDGIQAVLDALAKGRAVLVFPEGERTHTGAVEPLKPGISLLIKRVACPIVPVGVAGCFEAWSRFHKWPNFSPLFLPPRPSTIAMAIGKPIDPERYKGKDRAWVLEDLRNELVKQHAAAERLRRK
jgi:1-acyl-sn-glycerol-3-phosphate acyltransferase